MGLSNMINLLFSIGSCELVKSPGRPSPTETPAAHYPKFRDWFPTNI
jgi:hypothetical protein